ncbi:hypothetical protein ACFL43_04145 [Thermodesulfobacteriota bacterium]
MTNPRLRCSKLVYPARLVHNRLIHKYKLPEEWSDVIKDSNFSMIGSGRTGSGKDSLTQSIMNNDLAHGRTVIILDVKNEYPLSIFAQLDVTLKNILLKHGLVGRGYIVNLWIPYIKGMTENSHFQELLTYHHPNLRIRPFRLLRSSLISEDSANMAMSKTSLQSMADKDIKLKGGSAQLNALREHMAKMKMAFDDEALKEEGEDTGWEYINFDKMTNNKQINVISTFFMAGKNIVAATQFMIGILNELMTIGKGVHRYRGVEELFTVIIPEVQIIMPKRVKALDDIVNTLKYSMLTGLLLMRSFGTRLRINLQNLSSLDPDMLSQSRIFVGRTWNYKDLKVLGSVGINKRDQLSMTKLQVGEFVDVMNRNKFNIVPFSHKARENEPLVKVMREYQDCPSKYLFETDNAFLSEIVNYKIFFDKRPLTVQEYERRVKAWIKDQPKYELQEIPENSPEDILSLDDTYNEVVGAT